MNCNYCIIKQISALYDMFDKETKNCIIKSEAAEMPLCQDHGVGKFPALFKEKDLIKAENHSKYV